MSKPVMVVPLLFLLAAGSGAFAAERSGEEIYAVTCASCHGTDGRGSPASLTGLLVKPRDFTDFSARTGTRPSPRAARHAAFTA